MDNLTDLPLFLHIGYHKTGTTYLQRNVFNSHPEIYYLGVPWINTRVRRFFREFKFTHDLDFDPSYFSEDFSQLVQDSYSKTSMSGVKRSPKILLVSSESLHSGPEWFGAHLMSMANRLKQTFRPCKIIIGIRNQRDYIVSNYKEYVLHGGKISFKQFLHDSFVCNYYLMPKLQFDRVISLYRQLFGSESIYFYLQEKLKSIPVVELQQLMDFFQVDRHVKFKQETTYKSLSKTSVELVRLLNKLVAKDYNQQYYKVQFRASRSRVERARRRFISVLRSVETRARYKFTNAYINQADIDHINDYFRNSNRNLSEMTSVDIRQLGYNY